MKRKIGNFAFVTALAGSLVGCAVGVPGGDGVSNGGGLGEKNFVYAYTQLPKDLKNCITAINCALAPDDEKIVRAVVETLANGTENLHGIEFKSPKEAPGLFVMDGKPRTARTGTKPGDKIYVNVEHLYRQDAGFVRPITVRESTALLIHELAHHHGIGSSDEEMRRLDEMSAKILAFLREADRKADAPNGSVVSLGLVPVLSCRSIRLDGGKYFSLYYARTAKGPVYQAAWERVSRERPKDPFLVRIKHSDTTVQVLPELDGTEDFDLRIDRRAAFAGAGGRATAVPALPLYGARMARGDTLAASWDCTVNRDGFDQLADPMWVLFLR